MAARVAMFVSMGWTCMPKSPANAFDLGHRGLATTMAGTALHLMAAFHKAWWFQPSDELRRHQL